jgi:hypothetical protein
MQKIILDPALKAKLNNLEEHLEVCDESGKIVGHFLPTDAYNDMVMAWAESQITEEELERLRQEPRGRPLAEIWKSLGQP